MRDVNGGCGYIYVVQMEDTQKMFKLGWSFKIKARLKNLQCDCPYKLTCVALYEGDLALEKELHDALSGHTVRGEWFRAEGLRLALDLLAKKSDYPIDPTTGRTLVGRALL